MTTRFGWVVAEMLVAMLAAIVVATLVAMLVEVVELFLLAFNLKLKKTTMTTQIDDLPDVILVEILARLPCKKMVFQAKCASKPWSSLLSDSFFVKRFLSLQGVGEENTFIGAGIVAVLPYPKNKLRPKLEVLAHPVVKTKGSHFSLDFLSFFKKRKKERFDYWWQEHLMTWFRVAKPTRMRSITTSTILTTSVIHIPSSGLFFLRTIFESPRTVAHVWDSSVNPTLITLRMTKKNKLVVSPLMPTIGGVLCKW